MYAYKYSVDIIIFILYDKGSIGLGGVLLVCARML